MQQAVGRLGSFISQSVYTVTGPLHPFGGAVDIVVVEQPDGTFKSSPWYVRFGKFQGVLKARERLVHITVNGVDSNFHMYLDHKGEAFFLREIDAHEGEAESDVIYPSSSGDDTDHDNDKRSLKSKRCNLDSQNGKIVVARTSSRRSRILGLVFGRRSLKGQIEENADVNKVDSLERAEIAANLLELKWSTNLTGDGDQPPLKHTEQILGSSSGADKMDNGLHQGDSNEDTCSNSDFELGQDLSTRIDGKEVIYDVTGSDLQVACMEVVEARMEKQLEGEEVSGVSTVSTAGNNISEVDISADGIQSLVYCETSECSKVGMDCSTEQVHVHDEVLHGTTVMLPEGTETEEVTKNVDLGMPVMEVSEFHSGDRQTNCSDSDVGMNDVADVEDLPTSPKSQTVNMDLGHFSTEKVESNYVTKPTCYRRLEDQTLDENNMKDKDVSSTLSSPLRSLGDCLPRKTTRTSLSASSEEENFLFSDLDESRINDQFEGSTSPEYVDKEDHLSYENGTEKVDHLVYANYDLHSPLENSTTENQSSDLEKLRVISSPIVIPRNEAAGEEVGQHTGSLPNISTYSDSLGQHDVCYPLSQSLGSKSTSLQWTFPGKDDLKYLNSDEDKENELSHEKLAAKDYHSSGEFNNTVLNLPVGDPSTLNPSPGENWRIWPFSLRRSGSRNAILPTPTDAKDTTLGNSLENTISTVANENELKPNLMKKKVRENTPTSEQVASLNLKEGRNIVTFTFSTAMLGKQQVDARIYLWKWNTHIVISDVDGTITKSDVLGQFMPLVGIDWSQTGVAHLFSAIKENGYQLLFLSARSISQAYLTRQFLVNLKQDGKVLPDGPVVISPDGLFPSLYREVIRRVPHEFKIACLEGIRTLFPSDCNPFYAGFGNRDTDEISYLKVGIPKGKIFIINPKGEVAVNRRLDMKSYTSLHALVNGMFPPMNSSEQEDYNSWNYWKLPPPVIDI